MITSIPTIVFEQILPKAIGCVDFHTYDVVTIRLARQTTWCEGILDPATDEQIASTLAHEIGHIAHLEQGINEQNIPWIETENLADEIHDLLVHEVGRDDLYRVRS